jgi:hypothetical protein
MQQKLKMILFIILFALLWLPFIQEQTKIFKEPKLTGAFVVPPAPKFSIDSLKELSFQKKFEDFENYNFGFRGLMVKARNSIDYILFNDLSADNLLGKNGSIFNFPSVEKTLGIVYNGRDHNMAVIERVKFLKESIEKNGGHFLTVIAPSKEKIFPDNLPDRYSDKQKSSTNYDDFIEGYHKEGIPVIDFCPYINKLRKESQYPMFTKTGFHWSLYAASFAQDSLISYMEQSLGKPFPKFKRTGVEFSDTARHSDADIEFSLNLFFSIGQSKYIYPKYEFVQSTSRNYRPKVIIIGDSFFWALQNLQTLKNVFSEDSRFWFYFSAYAYPLNFIQWQPVPSNDFAGTDLNKNVSIMDELQSADYVILFGNIGTMPIFPYGITDFYSDHISDVGIFRGVFDFIKHNPKWNKDTPIDTIRTEAKHIYRGKKIIQLKAANNKYLRAGDQNERIITASVDNPLGWETFSLIELGNNQVAIYSYKFKFLSADLGSTTEVTDGASALAEWELFTMIKLEKKFVAFKAYNGKYLSLDNKTLQIFANGNSIGANEKFMLKTEK